MRVLFRSSDPWHAVFSFVVLGLLDGGDGIGAADRIPQRHPLGELIPAGLAAGHVRHPIGDGPAGHLRAVEVQARLEDAVGQQVVERSEEHTSELQSLMRISYAVFCLKKKTIHLSNHVLYLVTNIYKVNET